MEISEISNTKKSLKQAEFESFYTQLVNDHKEYELKISLLNETIRYYKSIQSATFAEFKKLEKFVKQSVGNMKQDSDSKVFTLISDIEHECHKCEFAQTQEQLLTLFYIVKQTLPSLNQNLQQILNHSLKSSKLQQISTQFKQLRAEAFERLNTHPLD